MPFEASSAPYYRGQAALIGDKESRVAAAAKAPEPIMVGDGTCMYKGVPLSLLSVHLENGSRYVSQPRGAGTPVVWRCRNGRLLRVNE